MSLFANYKWLKFNCINGSFQNQSKSPLLDKPTPALQRQMRGKLLSKTKLQLRGTPKAASLSPVELLKQDSTQKLQNIIRTNWKCCQRAWVTIGIYAEHFWHQTQETGGRKISYKGPEHGQQFKNFLVSASTVRRFTMWETKGEEALQDHWSTQKDVNGRLLFACPDLVFELKSWINKRLKQGGKHADGFLPYIIFKVISTKVSYMIQTLCQFKCWICMSQDIILGKYQRWLLYIAECLLLWLSELELFHITVKNSTIGNVLWLVHLEACLLFKSAILQLL